MNTQIFKAFSKNLRMSEAITFKELVSTRTDFDEFDIFIQFLGISDAENTELFEGDIIELKITEELMDHNKNMFFNSNLGKLIEKEKDITSVLLFFEFDKNYMTSEYKVYFCYNGKIERDKNGEISYVTSGSDINFPLYLTNKGAIKVGNILLNENLLNNL